MHCLRLFLLLESQSIACTTARRQPCLEFGRLPDQSLPLAQIRTSHVLSHAPSMTRMPVEGVVMTRRCWHGGSSCPCPRCSCVLCAEFTVRQLGVLISERTSTVCLPLAAQRCSGGRCVWGEPESERGLWRRPGVSTAIRFLRLVGRHSTYMWCGRWCPWCRCRWVHALSLGLAVHLSRARMHVLLVGRVAAGLARSRSWLSWPARSTPIGRRERLARWLVDRITL